MPITSVCMSGISWACLGDWSQCFSRWLRRWAFPLFRREDKLIQLYLHLQRRVHSLMAFFGTAAKCAVRYDRLGASTASWRGEGAFPGRGECHGKSQPSHGAVSRVHRWRHRAFDMVLMQAGFAALLRWHKGMGMLWCELRDAGEPLPAGESLYIQWGSGSPSARAPVTGTCQDSQKATWKLNGQIHMTNNKCSWTSYMGEFCVMKLTADNVCIVSAFKIGFTGFYCKVSQGSI